MNRFLICLLVYSRFLVYFRLLVLIALLFGLLGCEKKHERASRRAEAREAKIEQQNNIVPIKPQNYDYTLSVIVDLSGSFAEFMQEDGRAYRFLLRAIEDFFKQRFNTGTKDRILISQVSGTQRALLWHGTTKALRADFPSAAKFNQFLRAKSDPRASFIYRGIADTLAYMLSEPGIASGHTKTAVLVLSDMLDNEPNGEASLARLVQLLGEYGQKQGVVAMYWVDDMEAPRWEQLLKQANLRSHLVESKIVSDPLLPQWK